MGLDKLTKVELVSFPQKWVVKIKLSPQSGSVALRQLNLIYKKRVLKVVFLKTYLTQLCNLGPIWAKIMEHYVSGNYVSWLALKKFWIVVWWGYNS